jgi:hypothetical protein
LFVANCTRRDNAFETMLGFGFLKMLFVMPREGGGIQ